MPPDDRALILDARTTALLVSLMIFAQSGVILLQSHLVKAYGGLRLTALASFCMAVGTLLLYFRGETPPHLTIILSNLLILLGMGLLYLSLCRFIPHPPNFLLLAVPLLLGGIVLPVFTYFQDNLLIRILFMDTGISVYMAGIVWLLSRKQSNAYRLTATLLLGISCLFILLMSIRSILTLLDPPLDLFEVGGLQRIVMVLFYGITFMWIYLFSLMVSQRLQSDLNDLADLDGLTHILNRRGLLEALDQEFARKRRNGMDFALLIMDLDHLKLINDRYGHSAGDQALISLSRTIEKNLRIQDRLGRWGGDEFLVLLPETSLTDALHLAERLRMAALQIPIADGGTGMSLSISIGVGHSLGCEDPNAIYRQTDSALYRAKQSRNRVAGILNPLEAPYNS